MITLTRAQREALHRKWKQDNQGMSYREFRKSAGLLIWDHCLLVRWCGMTLGIERDGHVHS